MEDPSRSERRRALRGGKPRTKNTQRAKLPPESTEHTNLAGRHGGDPSPQQDASGWSVRATSPVQSGPPGRPGTECTVQREPCSGTSVLQSKVKALKEKRTAGKQGGPSPQDQGSPKAGRGKLLASEEGPSEDMVVNPQAQIRTYLTDSLLNGAEEVGDQWAISVTGPGTSQAKAPRGTDSEEESPRGSRISLQRFWTPPCTKQAPPGFPDSSVSKMRKEKGLASELWGKTCARRDLQLLLSAEDLETDRVARTPEDLQFVPTEVPCDGSAPTRRLWRAESWGSLGSAASTGSITSLPSLAERVERNRALLKEMLTAADQACNHEPGDAPAAETEETSGDSRGAGPLPNDPDRDSGISLLDSEGCRAFVPQQELVLSTRHEQAKQLLQRARMKARTSPLRASHHILPSAAGISPESEGRNQTQDVKQNSLQRNRDGHPSGNLSDSSSSESSCGRLNRGPSPSRVRFEDESARDAEVRYLERLQQRQKRALDSVILSLGQGPLVSKPDLSDYISGDLLRKQNGINKACKQQSCAQSPGRGHHETLKGSSTKTLSPVIREEGTCSSCGSYIVKSPANLNSDVCVKLISNELSGVCSVDQEELSPCSSKEGGDPILAQQGPTVQCLGSRGSPLWILPSRQRIQTERIKETYIGKVTYIDDVDSALDSTDTSDSCRTDSEEAGTSFSHARVNRGDGSYRSNEQKLNAGNLEREAKVRQVQGENSQVKSNAVDVNTPLLRDFAKTISIVDEERTNSLQNNSAARENYLKPSGMTEPVGCFPASILPTHSMVRTSKVKIKHTTELPTKQTLPNHIVGPRVPVPPSGKSPSLAPYRKSVLADSCRLSNQETGQPDMGSGQFTSQGLQNNGQLGSLCVSEGEMSFHGSSPLPESEGHIDLHYASPAAPEERKNCFAPSVSMSTEETPQPTSKPVSRTRKSLQCTSVAVSEIQNLQRVSASSSEEQKTPPHTSVSVPGGQRPPQNTSVSVSKRRKKAPQYTAVSGAKGQKKPGNTFVSVPERQDTQRISVPAAKEQSNPKKPSTSAVPSRSQLGALSTNNCNNVSTEQQSASQTASRAENGIKGHFMEESNPNGAGTPPSAMGAISSAGITISLLTDDVESSCSERLPVEEPQKTQGPVEQSSLPSGSEDANSEAKPALLKRGGSCGLKKFFSAIGHSTRQKLGRLRSSSEEHIAGKVAAAAPGRNEGAGRSTLAMKKAPSLQSLQPVSPFHQPRKASSFQNLHSLLGKSDRSSAYLLGAPGEQDTADRKFCSRPRRALSVEDIGSPGQARIVGRVVETFHDGTCQLELQRPPFGSFGFCISSGKGRPDTGVYIEKMSDASIEKLYAGLLGVGDEILEVNGLKVAGLSLAYIGDLMAQVDTLSVRVLQQRRPQR